MINNIDVVSYKGYILNVSKYRDLDAIVNLLTENGVVSFKASKALDIKSKNHFISLIGNLVLVDIKKSTNTLQGGKLIEDNTSIYQNITDSLALQALLEANFKLLQENDEVPFDFFSRCINALKINFDPLTIYYLYLCQLLKVVGLSPNIEGCVICGKKNNLVSFSFYDGGFICKTDAYENNIKSTSIEYMKIIRYGFMVTYKDITRAKLPTSTLKSVITDLCNFLNDELGVSLNSSKMLLDIYK